MTDDEIEPSGQHPYISVKVMTEVGRVVGNWNTIEMMAQMIVVRLLKVSFDTGEAIFKGPSVPFQADVLIAVTKDRVKDSKLAKRLISAANKMMSLSNFRNDVVHGRWWIDEWGPEIHDAKPVLMKKGSEKKVSEAEFFAGSAKIKALLETFRSLLNEVSGAS